jgi:hypothetical protein
MSDSVPDAARPHGSGYQATIHKGRLTAAVSNPYQAKAGTKGKTIFVVFSGDLNKLIAAFIIANAALTMGPSHLLIGRACSLRLARLD